MTALFDELKFSERQAVIYLIRAFQDSQQLMKERIVPATVKMPEYMNDETLQSILDKLGGNIELNKKAYEEQQKNGKMS